MNARAIVTSFPLLRRAWRLLPGPLRLPLLLIGAVIYLWRRFTGRDQPDAQTDGQVTGARADRAAA